MSKFIEVVPYGSNRKKMLVNVGTIKQVYETRLVEGKVVTALRLDNGSELLITHSYDDVSNAIYYIVNKSLVSVLFIEDRKPKEIEK